MPPHLAKCSAPDGSNGMQWLEAEGHDRTSIDLPAEQHALATAVLALGKPTAIFTLNGGMVALEAEMAHTNTPALIEAFYPGAEGGRALADALFGVTNSWGKLPYTIYPAAWVNTTSMLDHDVQHGRGRTYRYARDPVLFPFGRGLSYTTFDVALGAAPPPQGWRLPTDAAAALNLSVVVTNRGARAGDEVVQAYFAPLALTPPLANQPRKALWAFERVRGLAAGASARVDFALSARDLQLADVDGSLVVCAGRYNLTFENGAGAVAAHVVELTGATVVVEPFPKPPPSSASW